MERLACAMGELCLSKYKVILKDSSALMALHESRPKDKPAGEFPGSPDSLEGSMERVTHIARIFNSKFEFVHYDGLSLYPPNGLYKAATNRYQAYQDTGNIKHLEGANELMIILKHFGKRWMAAGKRAY